MTNISLPRIISIVGTNASGKSSAGIELASRFNGEIISADSRQVYKNFSLCSGKVTAEEREQVFHHLIDICSIGENFTVADFQSKSYSIISDIINRGKLPFIVGGTGLYVNSVVNGYVLNNEHPNENFRANLESKTLEELLNMLPENAKARLKDNPSDYANKRRIIRLIEKIENGESLENRCEPRYCVLQIGITWPKDILYNKIDERLSLRIRQGMIEEVRNYLNNGGNPGNLYNLGLEYRYILWYITGKYSSLDELRCELSNAIKKFAKRQLTWFKRDKRIHWLNMMDDDYIGQASILIERFIQCKTI